ncbi:MAG: HD-GYP domain-containing protein [Angelakisella sp.]
MGRGTLLASTAGAVQKDRPRYALEPDDIELISTAAGLHDIGKVLIPESILKKPGKLTAAEFELVKQHTTLGARLVAEMPTYQNEALVKYIVEICLRHHERWNGEGYPDWTAGDECPIAAQVTALADVYDALTTRRSYKGSLLPRKSAGYDPRRECGSFNPLLLECLDALSDTIRRRIPPGRTAYPQGKAHLCRGTIPEPGYGRCPHDPSAGGCACPADFFTRMSREMWFEYTVQPSSLQLSLGAMQQTGLPAVMVDPLQNADFLTLIGGETAETVAAAANPL